MVSSQLTVIDDVNLTYDVTITGSLGPGVWSCCTLLCWDRRGTSCGGSGASRTSATVALATGAVALVAADPFGVLVGLVAVLGVETDYHLKVWHLNFEIQSTFFVGSKELFNAKTMIYIPFYLYLKCFTFHFIYMIFKMLYIPFYLYDI